MVYNGDSYMALALFSVWEQLLKVAGNDVCCDCGAENPQWASINLGITVCIGKLCN
jgi:hypothetical protein